MEPEAYASAAHRYIGVFPAQGGTWFTFNSLSGAGIIYFCKLKHLEPGGPR